MVVELVPYLGPTSHVVRPGTPQKALTSRSGETLFAISFWFSRGGAKLISHLSSPTDRPTLPLEARSDPGSADRPTLRRAQRGEARGSEIVGDHDPGDLRPSFRPTVATPLRQDRDGSEASRPTDPFWSLSGTISVKSTSRRPSQEQLEPIHRVEVKPAHQKLLPSTLEHFQASRATISAGGR